MHHGCPIVLALLQHQKENTTTALWNPDLDDIREKMLREAIPSSHLQKCALACLAVVATELRDPLRDYFRSELTQALDAVEGPFRTREDLQELQPFLTMFEEEVMGQRMQRTLEQNREAAQVGLALLQRMDLVAGFTKALVAQIELGWDSPLDLIPCGLYTSRLFIEIGTLYVRRITYIEFLWNNKDV